MTTPLAAASTNVYALEFDGLAVHILAKRRGKILRTIPLAELVAVDFKPATGPAGGSLRFRTAGKASVRDRIVFISDQQSEMQMFAAAVQRYHRPPVTSPAADPPWTAHAVASNGAAARPAMDPRTARSLRRWTRISYWLASLELAVVLIPIGVGVLIFGAVVVWVLTR